MPTLGTRIAAALAPRFTGVVEVGAGGMSTVFRAHDTTLDRDVAVKVLAPELATAPGVERFRREARILARLSHPHIVPVFDEGECEGLFFYVMAYLTGETLGDRLARGPLDAAATVRLANELLEALGTVHREGIVHRDIKPENIHLIEGRAVLTDFGVARWTERDDSQRTGPGARLGTLAYMAPEQLAGGETTPATDLYALAMVLYEALTGRSWEPIGRPERADWSGVPRRLAKSLGRALEPAPPDRWPDAAAFRRALATRARLVPLGAAAVILTFASAAGWYYADRAADVPAPPAADLMLLPFEEGDSAALGRRLARFAGMQLEWFPRWSVTPTLHSFARWDDAGRQGVLPAWFGSATYEARGAVVRTNDGWDLVITIHADSGRRLHEAIVVPGEPADPLAWGRRAADSLAARMFPENAAEFNELTARSTRSVRAVGAYLAGTDAFVLDDLDEAEARYTDALRLDPGFTQAAWQRMLVRRWERLETAAELQQLYRDKGHELPELYRELTAAQIEPDLRLRAALLSSVADSFASRGFARMIAADELFHRGPLVGIPLERSLSEFTRAAQTDPFADQASTYDHTAWGYINLGMRDSAREQIRGRARRGVSRGESATHAEFLSLAYDARFVPWRAFLKRTWLGLTADSATRAAVAKYVRLGTFIGVPHLQARLGAMILDGRPTAAVRAQAQTARALAFMTLGRWDEGLAELDEVDAGQGSAELQLQRAEWRLVPELLGMPARPAAERAAAVAQLSASASSPNPPLATRAAWTLALEALRRGDNASYARSHAAVHGAVADATAERLDVLLHAYAAAAAGNPDSALMLTDPLFQTDSAGRIGGPFARSATYLGRAEWLRALGDPEAAERALLWHQNSDFSGWLEGPPQAAEVDQVFGGLARLRRADAVAASGETMRACALVTASAELWRDADPAVKSLLDSTSVEPCRR